ncbi:patatin-like phospholipase family protein [Streptomyces sp. E-08]|uniref:patatin-like phospholipase family protein n=1 Tax=Streptomyces sp. E-08 TaxID=3404047 RepID=UPI003CF5761F
MPCAAFDDAGEVPRPAEDTSRPGDPARPPGVRELTGAAYGRCDRRRRRRGWRHARGDLRGDAVPVGGLRLVDGCSAGGINGACFLAGGTWYPLSIYYDDLTNKQFVDFSRALRGQPILNLAYSFDHIMERVKPLDYEAVLRSPISLAVPITDVDALRTVMLREFASRHDLKAALRASAWLPISVPGTFATPDGRRAVDGDVLTALPFRLAVGDGCTHVLSLSTRPLGPAGSSSDTSRTGAGFSTTRGWPTESRSAPLREDRPS